MCPKSGGAIRVALCAALFQMVDRMSQIFDDPPAPVPETAPAPVVQEPTQQEIADSVRKKLEEAKFLKLQVTVTETVVDATRGGQLTLAEPLFVESYMAKEKVKTRAFWKGDRPIANIWTHDGIRRESRPPGTDGKPLFNESPAPFPHGTDTTFFPGPLDCFFGSYLMSWVDERMPEGSSPQHSSRYVGDYLRNRIIASKQLPDAVEQKQDCWVYAFSANGGEIVETYFVEKTERLVIRRDTLVDGINRSRAFKYEFKPEIPEGFDWCELPAYLAAK